MVGTSDKDGRDQVLRLLVRNRAGLFAFILALVRDRQFAEDVMQEVAVVICEQWADYRLGTDFCAWARRIARNKAFNMSRSARREIALSLEAIESIESAAAEDAASDQDLVEALRGCLGRLRRRASRLIDLRYSRGRDCPSIAEEMNTTVPAVYMALSRIRSDLADCVRSRLAREVAG